MVMGIPSNISDEALCQKLVIGVVTRRLTLPAKDLQDVRVVILNRRTPAPNQPSFLLNGGAHWVPSTSIRLFASRNLCKTILNEGGTALGFTF